MKLNKEILRLAGPSILANMTVPLVGMVDTAVAGHLHSGSSAVFIGAISVGSMVFSLLYWSFGFLRTGTGGLTAQAYGREDKLDCSNIFARSLALSMLISVILLAIQYPFVKLVLLLTEASPEVEYFAEQYFFIRVWAAPATLSLMAFRGWFVGMQDSLSSMWADLIVNVVNIVASIVLSFGIGSWEGMGFDGIATGTVLAQYSGFIYCCIRCKSHYGKTVLSLIDWSNIKKILINDKLKSFFILNINLMIRSVCFILVYVTYTMFAAQYGDLMLASSNIIMQLLMLFSYFTDGFAYAGEALAGRFFGARDIVNFRKSTRYVFIWSMSISLVFVGIYWFGTEPMLRLMTDDEAVVSACMEFLPWLLAMPIVGCAVFTWDGIHIGATSSSVLRDSMVGAAFLYLVSWWALKNIFQPVGITAIHLLLATYFIHLIFRAFYMTATYRRAILRKFVSL